MKIYNEKGITLIVLVITVILMLILAGVAISALTGDGGLFSKTRGAADAFEGASQREAKQIEDLMNEIDGYIGELSIDKKAPSVAKLVISNVTETSFTLTATGKDNVGIEKYEFYIKNSDGSFTLEKTIETQDENVTYDVTGKNLKDTSYIYKLKVYDKAGNSKESGEFVVEQMDTTAPSVATLAVSNITDTGFTLTATGEDERKIAKYEFYIKNDDGSFTLEKTIETSEKTATYVVTGKTPRKTAYEYKVKVYDEAENSKESDVISFGTKGTEIAKVVKVGDYVNYDAGVWTEEDLAKITSSTGNPTLHSTVNDATTGNQTLPTEQGQFGGFELGQSRNTNSTGFTYNETTYNPETAGWRVWNINNGTGVVTLISAGHPETYFNEGKKSSVTSALLKARDCSMYVNKYGTEAHILKGPELATWYNSKFGTSYTITENSGSNSTFWNKEFTSQEPISILNNGSYYWLATAYNSTNMYAISIKKVNNNSGNCAFGVRMLVSLKSDVCVEQNSGDGTLDNPWKIVK